MDKSISIQGARGFKSAPFALALLALALAACGGGTGGGTGGGGRDVAATAEAVSPNEVQGVDKVAELVPNAPPMARARYGHTATLLSNGKVLVAGGFGKDGLALDECELYDPATNRWSAAGSMRGAHGYARDVTLADGRVMMVGGLSGFDWGKRTYAGNEVYDPATNRWSTLAPLATPRTEHTATRLADGRVLVTGGTRGSAYPSRFGSLTSTEIYDPVRNVWSAAAPLPHPRSEHTAALQADGRVLIAGFDVKHYADESTRSTEGGIDFFDPSTNLWQNVTYMVDDVSYGLVAALPDGKVLTNRAVLPIGTPWKAIKGLATDRTTNSPFVLYPDGGILTAGGGWNLSWAYGFNDTARQDFYDPATQTWSAGRSMAVTRDEHTLTLMPNGKVLVAGGRDPAYTPLNSAEFLIRGLPLRKKAVRSDYDGDGKSDILWRQKGTGALERWTMNGLNVGTASKVGGATTAKLIGDGDYNADGKSDLMFDDGVKGTTAVWVMDGSKRTRTATLKLVPTAKPFIPADLHGDDHKTVLWWDGKYTTVLLIDEADPEQVSWTTDAEQKVVAVGDFNGDRRDDLVVFDSRDGSTSIWLMHGPRRLGRPITLWRSASWTVVAAPDLDGDGQADLLLRNAKTGAVSAWLMNGTKKVSSATLLTDKRWTVASTPDLNGDGREDILWYRADTGTTAAWLMNGTQKLASKTLRTDRDWTPVGP